MEGTSEHMPIYLTSIPLSVCKVLYSSQSYILFCRKIPDLSHSGIGTQTSAIYPIPESAKSSRGTGQL